MTNVDLVDLVLVGGGDNIKPLEWTRRTVLWSVRGGIKRTSDLSTFEFSNIREIVALLGPSTSTSTSTRGF